MIFYTFFGFNVTKLLPRLFSMGTSTFSLRVDHFQSWNAKRLIVVCHQRQKTGHVCVHLNSNRCILKTNLLLGVVEWQLNAL